MKKNSAYLFNRGYLKMAIIKSMRGFEQYSPAVGKSACIREAILVERIEAQIGQILPNELLCDLIKELRDLYIETPQRANKTNYWAFNVVEPNGTQYAFKVFANEYICGGNHGRYLPANAQELADYQEQRRIDYETQLKNFNSAGRACKLFPKTNSDNQTLFSVQ